MRSFGYAMLGIILTLVAIGMVAYRQFDVTPDTVRQMFDRDAPAVQAEREAAPGGLERQDRTAVRAQRRAERQEARQWRSRDGQWRIAEMMLDAINAVVGLIGIVLALRVGRGQRQSAH
jgi:hypothetical protein